MTQENQKDIEVYTYEEMCEMIEKRLAVANAILERELKNYPAR